ncbi:MAG: M23 family metallopeptidase [Gemmatimonadales bacterium]|nr:MAG: M23 family metallopeptidase [Gemmatimonadales bacterium]
MGPMKPPGHEGSSFRPDGRASHRRPDGGRRLWRRMGLRSTLTGVLLLLVLGGCHIPRWPVAGEISSPFGLRSGSGVLPSTHHGVDIPLPEGTPVRAALPGRVRFAGTMTGYGEVIWLEHRRGTLTVYAHLSRIDVSTGAEVDHRQVIGLSGATGRVTAPHLHFEVWMGGRPVDPVHVMGPRPRPSTGRGRTTTGSSGL